MTLSHPLDQEQGDKVTEDERGFATLQLHSGDRPGSGVTPRATPIYLTAGFVMEDFDQAADLFENGDGYTYTRVANPTAEAVEQKVALLERGAEALLVSSGQAAVAITLLGLLDHGQLRGHPRFPARQSRAHGNRHRLRR
jgi:O-acetylhomoserine (thiol)-lyase